MCTSKKDFVQLVQNSLTYVKEDVESALEYAKNINDPELTKKLEEIKTKAVGVKDCIVSKTDPKTFG